VDNHAVDSTSTSSIVTPWNVSGVVDYEKLIEQFGSQKIDQALLNKMERLTVLFLVVQRLLGIVIICLGATLASFFKARYFLFSSRFARNTCAL